MIIELDELTLNRLTVSERAVIDYANENASKVLEQTISDIADASFTSISTVSRAVRKCGYSGLPDLRMKISNKLQVISEPLLNEVLQRVYDECTQTIDNIRISDIIRIVNFIKSAKKIIVLARGTSVYAANEFAWHLQLLRYNAFVFPDAELMRKIDKLATSEDLIVIFTAFNTTKVISDVAKVCHESIGCKVATICGKNNTECEKYSDVALIGRTIPIDSMNVFNVFNVASRTSLQIISKVIIEYMCK